MTLSKKWVVIVPTIVLAVTAFIAWPYLPKRYQSTMTMVVVPQRVPELYVKSTVTTRIEERLGTISQQILSRTRLERIIQDFNLYPRERRIGIMEDVVDQMQKDISIQIIKGDAFRVSYTSSDPRTAMRVAEKLSGAFIEESLTDRSVLAEQTTSFIETQVEDVRQRLVEHAKRLEQARIGRNGPAVQVQTLEEDVLGATYKSLLAKLEDAKLAANLERRQIGEQFRTIDPARIPEKPLGATRGALTVVGAVAGLCLGLTLVVVSVARRAAMARRPKS
jgi:uncharacterized protein involved in exopolysaccharide biosynthesis